MKEERVLAGITKLLIWTTVNSYSEYEALKILLKEKLKIVEWLV